MSISATWQFLPEWLRAPLAMGAISLAEASELWDLHLMLGEPDRFTPECPRLQQAASRIGLLLDQEVSATRH